KKKDGGVRPVIDYRRVNDATVPDRYPLPVLSELLQSLGSGNMVFSTLDLQSGFWQVELEEKSREISAFSTPRGHFEFTVMPFGLRNAPLTFQRLVNCVFEGIIGKNMLVFIDDLIVFTPDLKTHLEVLDSVFHRLKGAGLKVKLRKCRFLQKSLSFLGHTVDVSGIHTMPDKVEAVQKFRQPTKVEHIRSFLGLSGYYRAFIKDYSTIARPLTRLLKKDTVFQWTEEEQNSFSTLKSELTKAPVLAFPDFEKPFHLYTDASGVGVGAALMQVASSNGKLQPIAYASRTLNSAELNYSVTHQETLAVVWALKHYKDIIWGYEVVVHTDHTAIRDLFVGRNLSGRVARWFETITTFEPTFKYVPGPVNRVADALSRHVSIGAVSCMESLSVPKVQQAQLADPLWSQVITALKEDVAKAERPKTPVAYSQLLMHEGMLYRVAKRLEVSRLQLVVPASLVPTVLTYLHDADAAGHPGKSRCL
ncbi:MAG: hypothetical protein GY770_31340, partial [Aestuariibacter sp.]|nr:hypothetical protein [Aestuariibacter sp.]